MPVFHVFASSMSYACRFTYEKIYHLGVQSTAAGHVGQNSSAHVARSFAAIWPLILFKWSQLYSKNIKASFFQQHFNSITNAVLKPNQYYLRARHPAQNMPRNMRLRCIQKSERIPENDIVYLVLKVKIFCLLISGFSKEFYSIGIAYQNKNRSFTAAVLRCTLWCFWKRCSKIVFFELLERRWHKCDIFFF